MLWLLTHPFPPHTAASCFSSQLCVAGREGGGVKWEEPNHTTEKAWFSINPSILSAMDDTIHRCSLGIFQYRHLCDVFKWIGNLEKFSHCPANSSWNRSSSWKWLARLGTPRNIDIKRTVLYLRYIVFCVLALKHIFYVVLLLIISIPNVSHEQSILSAQKCNGYAKLFWE